MPEDRTTGSESTRLNEKKLGHENHLLKKIIYLLFHHFYKNTNKQIKKHKNNTNKV